MEWGYIKLNKSPYGLPISFMDKKDEKLCMCIDYCSLNKTIQNNYPLPRINDLFNRLHGVYYFSHIDLKSGYYHICIEDANVENTTMKTKYDSYEFLFMPLGLCNAMSTFTTLMNSICHKNLDEFMIIYIDDILVYSKFAKEHVTHLEFVLQKFKKNKLYVN